PERHDEQMLYSAMLALAQNRGTGQKNCKYGDVIDDLVDGHEPSLLHIGIKACPSHEPDQFTIVAVVSSRPKRLGLLGDDFLNVRWTSASLAHCGCVGDDFNRGSSALRQVVLKFGRNIDNESVFSFVHCPIDLTERDNRSG